MGIYTETLVLNQHWADYLFQTKNFKYNFCEGAYRSRKKCYEYTRIRPLFRNYKR